MQRVRRQDIKRVRMRCATCQRVIEHFVVDSELRLWPRRPLRDRPTGKVPKSELGDLDGALRSAGLTIFRCHRRCGRHFLLKGEDLVEKCLHAPEGEFFV